MLTKIYIFNNKKLLQKIKKTFRHKGKLWAKCNSTMIMKNNLKAKNKWTCFWFLKNIKGPSELGWKKIGLALPKNHNLILSPPKFHFRLVKINNHLLTLNGLTQIYQFWCFGQSLELMTAIFEKQTKICLLKMDLNLF